MKSHSNNTANLVTLDDVISKLKRLGSNRIIYKQLSPNDNSKNQIYLASEISDIGFIPTKELIPSKSESRKNRLRPSSIKFTASLNWKWLSPSGEIIKANNAKLIYYPQYPEVRLSGFIKGCSMDFDGWMDPCKKGRSPGRLLILGLRENEIYAYLGIPNTKIVEDIGKKSGLKISNVFYELEQKGHSEHQNDERLALLSEIKRINSLGYIKSKRLDKNGNCLPYLAANGGGYTLEAELGIIPNGKAEPDYLGWEVKQFSVKKFQNIDTAIITLMTPEPDGGIYKTAGVLEFIKRYGYAAGNDRYNFNGVHRANQTHNKTNLTLHIEGFDVSTEKIIDAFGFIGLVDKDGSIAASWSFTKLVDHWKKKHGKAVYIPSMSKTNSSGEREYIYGNYVRLFQGASISKLLAQIAKGIVYYDPGIKVENISTRPKPKLRSQFRIKSKDLHLAYKNYETLDLQGL